MSHKGVRKKTMDSFPLPFETNKKNMVPSTKSTKIGDRLLLLSRCLRLNLEGPAHAALRIGLQKQLRGTQHLANKIRGTRNTEPLSRRLRETLVQCPCLSSSWSALQREPRGSWSGSSGGMRLRKPEACFARVCIV